MPEQLPVYSDNKHPTGFLNRALDATPQFVVAFVGSMFGVTLCFIAVLQLGGLAVPVNNYLTAQLSPTVRGIDASAARLDAVAFRIEDVVRRLAVTENATLKQGETLLDHEKRLVQIETQIRRLRGLP